MVGDFSLYWSTWFIIDICFDAFPCCAVNDAGRGRRPFPNSLSAPVIPPGYSVVLLLVRDPEPIPYAGMFDFVGQSGV